MLLPSEMSHVTILIYKQDSDKLISSLHKKGFVQFAKKSEMGINEASMHQDVGILAEHELRISRIIELLKGYVPKRKGIKALLKSTPIPKRPAIRTMNEKIAEASRLLNEIEPQVLDAEKTIADLQEQINILQEQEKTLSYLSLFDIDIEWLGISSYTVVTFGLTTDIEAIKEAGLDYFAYSVGDKKEERWAVIVAAHVSRADDIARLRHFEEHKIEGHGSPAEMRTKTIAHIKEIQTKITDIAHNMTQMYVNYKHDLLSIQEEIHFEKREKEAFKQFGETQYTYMIEGWCLLEDVEKVKTLVDDATHGTNAITFKEIPRDSKEPPIHLKNPRWAQPFEKFLELFAMPKYNEANPTMFVGLAFVIFFAFMLGDAGYGLLILLFSLYGRLKFKQSKLLQDWSFVGIILGVSTITAGLIFSSFFGDFIPRFVYGDTEQLLYQAKMLGISLPIDAIHKPVVVLAMALVLGLVHLNIGISLGVYQNIMRGHVKEIFKEQISMVFLQIGGGLLIGEIILKLWHLDSTITLIAWILTAIGLLLLFTGKGLIGFFDITGYMGDWLSYARLLALGLATTGMAMAFNIVAEIFSVLVPYIGFILLPIVLIFAHFINLILQSLGAGVHSLRLQYVEFFARFYSGGGTKFIPFSIQRKYTEEIK